MNPVRNTYVFTAGPTDEDKTYTERISNGMNKTQKQSGFAHLETLLLIVVVGIIVFTGWFVWHARSNATKNLNNAANTNQTGNFTKKTPDTSQKTKKTAKVTSPSLINYASTSTSTGIALSSDADIDKLDGASDSFKQFIKDKIDKNSKEPSPCGNAYGLTVKEILNDSFAVGGEGQCGGAEKLWAKVADQWQEIGATQQADFACSVLTQYKVPSAIAGKVCIGSNGEEPYDQS
jgi:cytoskeletal protein RodZ